MTIHFNSEAINQLDKQFRTHLINSIGGFKSIGLIGTQQAGHTNLAIFNSIVHIGAHPPLMGFIIRPDSVDRHTLENILKTKVYTINHINEEIYKSAHQTSARYSKDVSEFDAVGLKAIYKDHFLAPYVHESNLQIGLEFKEKIELSINNTSLIIGEIKHIYLPNDCLCEDGHASLEMADTLAGVGLDGYYQVKKISRLSCAKPFVESNIL